MNEQFVIRPVLEKDLPQVMSLAETANPGLTNLLPDRAMLEKKIALSMLSFQKVISTPENELYFFVIEEINSGAVLGTCGIFSDVGDEFYSFRVFREMAICKSLNIRRENHFLQLVNDYKDVSELALLLMQKKFRRKGLGKFLSRARYFYIADNLHRFHPHIIAEMRGRVDLLGHSVFWDALGARFVDISFNEADHLSAAQKKQFIPELFPHSPIPVAILPEHAQKVIGVAHPDTEAAVSVLYAEGFEYAHYVDIFDAGPTLEGVVKNLKTVMQSERAQISATQIKGGTGLPCMMSFQSDYYRIGLGEALCLPDGTLEISAELSKALNCQVNDTVRFIFI